MASPLCVARAAKKKGEWVMDLTKHDLIVLLESTIDSCERLKKQVVEGRVSGLGETLQNTWRIYYLLGQLVAEAEHEESE